MGPYEKLKKALVLTVAFAVFLSYSGFAQAEDSIEDLKRAVEQKNEEIRKLEEEAQKYRAEIASKQQMGETLKKPKKLNWKSKKLLL